MSLIVRLIVASVLLGTVMGGVTTAVHGATTPVPVTGDADCSGALAVPDAVAVIRYVAAMPPTASCITSGDVDCSGAVNLSDAIQILGAIAGLQQARGCALIWPFVGPVTNPFNPPDHYGIDIDGCNRDGAPVVAAAAGQVKIATLDNSGYGNYVTIQHADGSWTLYAHLQAYSVTPGQIVSQGQTIGGVGHTGDVVGQCGGTHLHFELHINGVAVDPLLYLPKPA
ncbi:MAG TPA: peptidoglycan DD-metalloendopeptidase family protein [Dehalococcoidia bacterium]|nr:peptidoglycan DD-metalloendopeptidase family protein [Dehalococcoidia bacterium]